MNSLTLTSTEESPTGPSTILPLRGLEGADVEGVETESSGEDSVGADEEGDESSDIALVGGEDGAVVGAANAVVLVG